MTECQVAHEKSSTRKPRELDRCPGNKLYDIKTCTEKYHKNLKTRKY